MKNKTVLVVCVWVALCFNAKAQFHQNLSFNGTNNIVDCGTLSGVLENVTGYTIEARVKFNTFAQWSTVLCKRTGDATRDAVLQCYSTSGQMGIAVASGYGYTSGTLQTGTWYHMAIVYDGNNADDSTKLKLFINGVQQPLTFLSTVPASTPVVTGSRFCLGAEYNTAAPFSVSGTLAVPFNGSLDEVRVWSVARSASSILAGMNAELSLPQTNLAAYYQFNQGTACQPNVSDTILTDLVSTYPGKLWNFALSGTTSNFTTVVDTSVTASGTLLSANASPATYQWYNCGTHSIVPLATGQSFFTTSNGSYAVIVTQGCTDTSGCFPLISVGINDINTHEHLIVYPNPSATFVTIDFGKFSGDISAQVFSMTGELLIDRKFSGAKEIRIDMRELAEGFYMLRVLADGQNSFHKIAKE